jgi:hypothetical protein
MKKTIKMIGIACLVGAFAFVGSSCKKEKTDTASFKVNLSEVEDATLPGERAYIDYTDAMKMKWSKDDQIMFYNLRPDYRKTIRNVYTLYEGEDTQEGYFNGRVMGDLDPAFPGYYGFYPASKITTRRVGPNNSETFNVPAEQHYNEGTMDPTSLVMAVMGQNIMTQGFTMKHIFGFINLRLKGTKQVQSITITDKALNLVGDITLDIPAVNSTTLSGIVGICADYTATWESYIATLNGYLHGDGGLNYISEPAGKTITLICDEPVQLNADEYTDFHISLRPGCLGKGFVVTVNYADTTSETFNQFDPTNAEWALGDYPEYPRAFCILPGKRMNVPLN